MQATQTEASSSTSSDRIPWGRVIATAVGLEVATVASAIAWVAIYSYLIHPGEDPAYYQDYAQVSSPVVAVVLGGPYWFFGCRWIARKAGSRAVAMSLAAWLVVLLIDLPFMFLGEPTAFVWVMFTIAHSLTLAGAFLGGRAALKRAETG
jgi:hypothetical protein